MRCSRRREEGGRTRGDRGVYVRRWRAQASVQDACEHTGLRLILGAGHVAKQAEHEIPCEIRQAVHYAAENCGAVAEKRCLGCTGTEAD